MTESVDCDLSEERRRKHEASIRYEKWCAEQQIKKSYNDLLFEVGLHLLPRIPDGTELRLDSSKEVVRGVFAVAQQFMTEFNRLTGEK